MSWDISTWKRKKIGWDNWLTALWFTQIRSRIEKLDMLSWTLFDNAYQHFKWNTHLCYNVLCKYSSNTELLPRYTHILIIVFVGIVIITIITINKISNWFTSIFRVQYIIVLNVSEESMDLRKGDQRKRRALGDSRLKRLPAIWCAHLQLEYLCEGIDCIPI